MKQAIAVVIALCAMLLFAGNSFATEGGKVILYGGAGQGKVIFDGKTHASAGFVCNDCHLRLFETRKKALIPMEAHGTDRACFACHNGTKAFAECAGCHRKF